MNLHYIRAAIEANTGIRLSLHATVRYLNEESMLTPKQRQTSMFTGYHKYSTTDTFIPLAPDDSEPILDEEFDNG